MVLLMIKEYIQDLHAKPQSHRKKVTYVASAVITVLIGLVWFTSFGVFNNSNGAAVADNTNSSGYSADNDNGPFAVVGSNISNAYQALKSAIGIKSAKTASNSGKAPSLEYVPE